MPIYRATLPGITGTLLLRAPSAAQAKDQIVELKALTSDELSDALEAGEKVYKQGDPIIPPTEKTKSDEGARQAELVEVAIRTHLPSGMHQSLIEGGNPGNDDDWLDEREATPEEIAAATPPAKKKS